MPYYNQPREYQSVVDPYIEGQTARQNALIRRNQIESQDINQTISRNSLRDYDTTRAAGNALAQNPSITRESLMQQAGPGNEGMAAGLYQKNQQAQMEQVRQRIEPMVMTALTIGRNNKDEAYRVIYDALPPDMQQKAGDPSTWNDTKLSQWLSPDNQAKVMTYMEKIAGEKSGQDYHPVPTAVGYQTFDKRKGTYAPALDAQGRPLMPITGDIELITRKKEATDRAAAEVKKEFNFPKARATFSAANRQWDFVGTQIDKAISAVNPFTAGVGAWASVIPASPQKDLKETLESIKANIGFDKLAEMRANSPTGGALGQVSDFENKLLQAVQGSLQQNQSPGQLKQNLQTVKEMLQQVRDERGAAFDQDYGALAEKKSSQTAPRGNVAPKSRFTIKEVK